MRTLEQKPKAIDQVFPTQSGPGSRSIPRQNREMNSTFFLGRTIVEQTGSDTTALNVSSASPKSTNFAYSFASVPPTQHRKVQPKLAIGEAADIYEQEADRVARQVHVGKEKIGEVKPIQTSYTESTSDNFATEDETESLLSLNKGHGKVLPDNIRAYMEPRFGVDFSQVRVHTGNEAAQMNRAIGAQAFTYGTGIYFATESGPTNLELVAHELTHVIQQNTSLARSPNNLLPYISESAPSQLIQRQLGAPTQTVQISSPELRFFASDGSLITESFSGDHATLTIPPYTRGQIQIHLTVGVGGGPREYYIARWNVENSVDGLEISERHIRGTRGVIIPGIRTDQTISGNDIGFQISIAGPVHTVTEERRTGESHDTTRGVSRSEEIGAHSEGQLEVGGQVGTRLGGGGVLEGEVEETMEISAGATTGGSFQRGVTESEEHTDTTTSERSSEVSTQHPAGEWSRSLTVTIAANRPRHITTLGVTNIRREEFVFSTGQATLAESGNQQLSDLVFYLYQRAQEGVVSIDRVEGHASPLDNADRNLDLSRQRAALVFDRLYHDLGNQPNIRFEISSPFGAADSWARSEGADTDNDDRKYRVVWVWYTFNPLTSD